MTQQIDDRFAEFETDNAMFIAARQAVHQARQGENTAFKRFSGKDFASDDLKKEDGLEDKYMSTAQGILNGLLYLPDTEPMYRKAQMARQVLQLVALRVDHESAKVKVSASRMQSQACLLCRGAA